jgi:hypothetical protein
MTAWVHSVHVEGNVQGPCAHKGPHPFGGLDRRGKVPGEEGHQFRGLLRAHEIALFPAQGADADLGQGNAHLPGPGHDAGVGVGAVLVALAQVGVGVDVQDDQIWMGAVIEFKEGQGHGMLAAQGQDEVTAGVQSAGARA